jgi:DNA modification methylase
VTLSAITNGDVNRIFDSDRSIHDWYRFVLSFPPHLVRQYLDDFNATPGQTVIDPFCGTGTTLVEARKLGYVVGGVEAHPMIHFACAVKNSWDINPEQFEQHSYQLYKTAQVVLAGQGLHAFGDLPLFAHNNVSPEHLRQLDEEKNKLLLTGSISPLPLHRTLELLDLIREKRNPWTAHQELALATTAVADASNLKFGPEVGVSRKKKHDADVAWHWYQHVRQMAQDLRALAHQSFPPAFVFRSDSRNGLPFRPQSVDYVITSPPYPNEKDYTRTTRLESVLLGFINTPQELRMVKKNLLRSNTRNIYVSDRDDEWGNQFQSVRSLAEQIEAKRIELGKSSGFEKLYHRVVSLYFGGMFRHFEALKPVLAPGALCAYVVGDQESFFRITIRTGELLAEIAEYCGFQVERIDLWRTRQATATKSQIREEVVILRWPG